MPPPLPPPPPPLASPCIVLLAQLHKALPCSASLSCNAISIVGRPQSICSRCNTMFLTLSSQKFVSCLQEAEQLAQEAHKTAGEGWRGPNVDKELAHSVEFHQSSIADAIEKANTDNARIYFQRVPNSVPQMQPAVMVTSAAPQGGCSKFCSALASEEVRCLLHHRHMKSTPRHRSETL